MASHGPSGIQGPGGIRSGSGPFPVSLAVPGTAGIAGYSLVW